MRFLLWCYHHCTTRWLHARFSQVRKTHYRELNSNTQLQSVRLLARSICLWTVLRHLSQRRKELTQGCYRRHPLLVHPGYGNDDVLNDPVPQKAVTAA